LKRPRERQPEHLVPQRERERREERERWTEEGERII